MNTLILPIIELIAGILINIFVGKLGIIIFRKNNMLTKIILRFIGIFLIVNSIHYIFHT